MIRVYFYDGGTLDCADIEIDGTTLIFSGVRYADISEIERMEVIDGE